MTDLVPLLAALAVLVTLAALARWAARALGQPAVLGELALGILLGPSLLGWVWPSGHEALLGGPNAPLLDALAWLGLVLFMLAAGAEMQWQRADTAAATRVTGMGLLVAGGAGALLAAAAPAWFFPAGAGLRGVLLVAILFSVTALPVLVRILSDLGLQGTRTAGVALAAATFDDVIAWTALPLVVGAGARLTRSPLTDLLLVASVLVAAVALDRLLAPLASRLRVLPATWFVATLAAAFAAAALTHAAGLHAVVGALAVGAIVSRHPTLRQEVAQRFQGVAAVVLLPLFFILTVGQADLRLVANGLGAAAVAATVLLMVAGKVGGAYLGARMAGLTGTQAAATGLLVNPRGAVGLVVAKVGFDAGVLSPMGFAVAVLAIVAVTLASTPAIAAMVRRVGLQAL